MDITMYYCFFQGLTAIQVQKCQNHAQKSSNKKREKTLKVNDLDKYDDKIQNH